MISDFQFPIINVEIVKTRGNVPVKDFCFVRANSVILKEIYLVSELYIVKQMFAIIKDINSDTSITSAFDMVIKSAKGTSPKVRNSCMHSNQYYKAMILKV